MAHLLMIHSNWLASGVQYPGISSIAAFVRKAGHRFTFFDLAEYTPVLTKRSRTDRGNFQEGELPLTFRKIANPERAPVKKPLDDMLDDLEALIDRANPDLVGFSCFSEVWPLTLSLIRTLRERFPDVPFIVGGVHATVAPEMVMAHPEVSAVCVGEGERPTVELLDSLDRGEMDCSIPTLWVRRDGEYVRNAPRPALQFDPTLPFLDWSDCSDVHFMYPFQGRLYRRGSVYLSRGCPYSCKYCINDFYERKLGDQGYRVRTKEVDFAIRELVHLKNTHDLEFLRFWDETFLAFPMDYFKAFAERYAAEVALPFTIESTAPTITESKVKLLTEMGCVSVSIGVETTDDAYRRKILGKPLSNRQFEEAFRRLAENGIKSMANFMFLMPHQPPGDMYRSILKCSEWGVDSPGPRAFFPYLGTWLRTYCFEHGLINEPLLAEVENEDGVQSLDDLSESVFTHQQTVLNFPPEVREEGERLMKHFVLSQETPQWMHEFILGLTQRNDPRSVSVVNDLERAVYHKRFPDETTEESSCTRPDEGVEADLAESDEEVPVLVQIGGLS